MLLHNQNKRVKHVFMIDGDIDCQIREGKKKDKRF